MKVWNEKVENCSSCIFFENRDNEFGCKTTDEQFKNYFDADKKINKDCPFNKPIIKEVIESFGFVIIKEIDGKINGQLLPEDPFKFYELDYDFEDKELLIEKFYQSKLLGQPMDRDTFNSRTIFNGIINNPEELKFILKRLNIIE